MMNHLPNLNIYILALLSMLTSCIKSDVFEHHKSIPNNRWQEQNKLSYSFDINDTLSDYEIFLTMRHTDAYPFSNLWLKVFVVLPGSGKSNSAKVEIPLAQADGKWLGRGMNELWEHQMPLPLPLPVSRKGKGYRFEHKGSYRIELQQIMRVNPLPEIMNIGIRVEKVHTSN